MAYGGFYDTGTVTVTGASVTVPGSGVLWSDVEQGDDFCCNGLSVPIDSVNVDLDELTLKYPWPGSTDAGADYVIKKSSWLRYDPALTQTKLREFLSRLDTEGLPFIVDGAAPNDADGEDDQWAVKLNSAPWSFWFKTGGAWVLQGTLREVLSAPRTYYVRSDGSDSNTGLIDTAGGAFLTITKAIAVVLGAIDFGGQAVTIKLQNTTWTERFILSSGWVGGGSLVLDVSGGTLNTSNHAISLTGVLPGSLTVQNVTLTTSGGNGINHSAIGVLAIGSGVVFGAVAGTHIQASRRGAYVQLNTNYSITGGAARHWGSLHGAFFQTGTPTITLTGTPAFSGAFAAADHLSEIESLAVFSGAATGVRYTVANNALINTLGAGGSYFPGNSAGSTATGGIYA